eukprot:Pgem_evm2s2179
MKGQGYYSAIKYAIGGAYTVCIVFVGFTKIEITHEDSKNTKFGRQKSLAENIFCGWLCALKIILNR